MEYSIREFRREDIADLARSANYPEVAEWLTDQFPSPYLFSDAEQFIRDATNQQDGRRIVRAICADDQVVGCVELRRGDDIYSHSAELGYFVTPAYRGREFALRAIEDMCNEFLDGCTLDRVYATPFAGNHASHAVLEKAGFEREGVARRAARKNGKVIDLYIYAKTFASSSDDA